MVRCPVCTAVDDRVVDSRLSEDGRVTRRRRECGACGHRFTTFERLDEQPLTVAKRSGEVVPFDRDKIIVGVRAAVKGRPVAEADIDRLVDRLEERARAGDGPIASEQLGLGILEWLADTDHVAYLRFASVYKGFNDPEDFQREVGLLKSTPPKSA